MPGHDYSTAWKSIYHKSAFDWILVYMWNYAKVHLQYIQITGSTGRQLYYTSFHVKEKQWTKNYWSLPAVTSPIGYAM